jgi:hypothetical protein
MRDLAAHAIAAADAAEAVGAATCFGFDSDSGAGLVAFDVRGVIAAADNALGRAADHRESEATHVDRMLASAAAQRLLKLILELQDQKADSLRILTIGASDGAAHALKGALVAYRISIASSDDREPIVISIIAPAPAAAPMRDAGGTMRRFGERAARAAKTGLRVEIGVVSADIGAVMKLSEGAILPVEMLAPARLTEGDGSRVIASGKVGDADGARALRVSA